MCGPPARAMGVGGGSAGVGGALMIPEGLVLMRGVGTHPWHLRSGHALNAHTPLTGRKFLRSLFYAERYVRGVLSHSGTGALARTHSPTQASSTSPPTLGKHIQTTPPKEIKSGHLAPETGPFSGGNLGPPRRTSRTTCTLHTAHCPSCSGRVRNTP